MLKELARVGGIFCLLGLVISPVQAQLSPSRVVVVANSNDPMSLEIAAYYMAARGIPERNLITLATSTDEKMSWSAFVETIFNPLRRTLVQKGWLQGTLTSQFDSDGRQAAAIVGHRIDFLVTCRLPLKIQHDQDRYERSAQKPSIEQFATNQAALDSELCFLAVNGVPTPGFVPNPLFDKKQVPSVTQQSVVKVARLDGPDLAAVKRCIDAALEGERLGVRGRAYVDQAEKSAETDNDWLGAAGEQLEALGFPTTVDKDPALMGWDRRMDATAFYFGWYGRPRESPLGDPRYRFPPGASALHIHSFSAETLRSQTRCWVGAFVHAGVTATMGNVYEPYLQMTHRPQLYVAGLAAGMSAGEAAYYAMPFLSWVCVFVGDPLYRPFAVDLSTQLEATPDALSQYAILRKMKLMRTAKAFEDAFVFGLEQYKEVGGLALAFHLARQYNLRGVRKKALEMLDPWMGEVAAPLDEWGLLYEVGRFLESIKQDEKALAVYANLVRLAEGTPEALYLYTPQAIEAARSLEQDQRAEAWQAGLTQLRITEEEARLREKLDR